MTPEQIDRDERDRVKRLTASARAERAIVHISKAKLERGRLGSRAARFRQSAFMPGLKILGFSSPAALGDALRREIVEREERSSQHGPVRVIMKNGVLLEPNGGSAKAA